MLFSLRPGLNTLPSLVIYEFDRNWKLMKRVIFRIANLNYAHDFALFPDYYLFHITPFANVSSWDAIKILGGITSPGESMRHYPHLPSKFVLIPRNATSEADIKFFNTDRFHVSNNSVFFCIYYNQALLQGIFRTLFNAKIDTQLRTLLF